MVLGVAGKELLFHIRGRVICCRFCRLVGWFVGCRVFLFIFGIFVVINQVKFTRHWYSVLSLVFGWCFFVDIVGLYFRYRL